MIIDSHLHLRDDVYVGPEGTPDEILRMMDGAGVDKSVVFKIWCSTNESIRAGEEAAETAPDRLLPYAYAAPAYDRPVLAELDAALSGGPFRGIKLHAADASMAPYLVDPVVELAGRHGVPVLIDFCGDVTAAERLAGDFPDVRIIVAHIGQYRCTSEERIDQFIASAARHENLVLDVSGVILHHKVRDAVRRVGATRVTWGTDGPRNTPDSADFTRMELAIVRAVPIEPQETDAVLGASIASLLDL